MRQAYVILDRLIGGAGWNSDAYLYFMHARRALGDMIVAAETRTR